MNNEDFVFINFLGRCLPFMNQEIDLEILSGSSEDVQAFCSSYFSCGLTHEPRPSHFVENYKLAKYFIAQSASDGNPIVHKFVNKHCTSFAFPNLRSKPRLPRTDSPNPKFSTKLKKLS